MQGLNEMLDRREVAQAWFEDEFVPVVDSLQEADLIADGTEADAYIRVVRERYMLLRTHEWDDDVIARLQRALD